MKKDGGPAFPTRWADGGVAGGMTLRDFFAATALNGLLAGEAMLHIEKVACKNNVLPVTVICRSAFECADQMLRERDQ